jgi:glutaredoxin-like YruB-family protein
MSSDSVIIYSADWCAFCHAAKNYLDRIGVKYTEKNIEHNIEFAREAYEKSGQMGIPVIDIQNTIIVGFDRPNIDHTLKEKKITT